MRHDGPGQRYSRRDDQIAVRGDFCEVGTGIMPIQDILDAANGVGAEYVKAVLDNTISLLATATTTADVVATWSR